MHAKRGFTLIELLVVVAIIALLMAILLPSLGRAREQAKAVACQSNVRQFGLAFRLYGDENNNRHPDLNPYYPSDARAPGQWWMNKIALYIPVKQWQSESNGNTGIINPGWTCPALSNTSPIWGGGYGASDMTIRYGPDGGSYSLTRIEKPATQVLLGDTWYPRYSLGTYYSWVTMRSPLYGSSNWNVDAVPVGAPRHPNNTVNIVFYDGHAEPMKWDDLRTNKNKIFNVY